MNTKLQQSCDAWGRVTTSDCLVSGLRKLSIYIEGNLNDSFKKKKNPVQLNQFYLSF